MSRPADVRPLTETDSRQITKPVIEGLGEIIFGSPSIFERDEFTAAPPSGNPFTDTVRSLTQLNCRIWARTDKSRYRPGVNAANSNICGKYLETIGEKPPDGDIGIPFTGGQCAGGYGYLARAEAVPGQPLGLVNANGFMLGPLSNFRTVTADGRVKGFLTGRSETRSSCTQLPATGELMERQIFDVQDRDRGPFTFSITQVCAGNANNCGDPPPTVRPPGRITGGTPPPPVNPINIPGFGPTGVTVGPNPDGDIEVCFVELNLCVTVTEGEPGGGADPGPTEPPPPNGPNENGPGDEGAIGGAEDENQDGDLGPPPEGRAWVGAFVEFTVPSRLGNIPSANASNPAYATVVGNVSLDHGGRFSEAKQVRSKWVGIFRENPNLTVRGVRVNVRPGVSFRVYPVSAEICPESICPLPED